MLMARTPQDFQVVQGFAHLPTQEQNQFAHANKSSEHQPIHQQQTNSCIICAPFLRCGHFWSTTDLHTEVSSIPNTNSRHWLHLFTLPLCAVGNRGKKWFAYRSEQQPQHQHQADGCIICAPNWFAYRSDAILRPLMEKQPWRSRRYVVRTT
jgi:hypothetical protein